MQAVSFTYRGWTVVLATLLFSTGALAQAPTPEPVTDQETELGKAMYDQLRAKAEIIQSSPLYDNLKPIADAISRVSQSRYPHPFKFYLVHEAQPNAFATPGGNVYVVTGSDICAEAGYNPWGLVWLFRDFENANLKTPPQLLSDHPANNTRVTTLEKHFKDNPGTFSKFDSDPKTATPFSVPADAPVVFLPPAAPSAK